MHIILVETTLVRGFDIIEEMLQAGIEVTFIAQNMKDYFEKFGQYNINKLTNFIEIPELGNSCNLAQIIQTKIGDKRIDGVICRNEAFLDDVAKLTKAYNLPGETLDTARLLMDKAAVRKRITDANLCRLKWGLVNELEKSHKIGENIGYPLVVKPLLGGWSRGVSIVHDESELDFALAEVEKIQGCPNNLKNNKGVLFEEFIEGNLISAEVLIQNGAPLILGYSERFPIPSGVTAEVGGIFPAEIEAREKVDDFVRKILDSLGVQNSAIHMEIMLTEKGPELIEINGRIAGYVVMQQISYALERSITNDLVAIATGLKIHPLKHVPSKVVAIQPIWSNYSGTVIKIYDQKHNSTNVLMEEILVSSGDKIAKLKSNKDRFGLVMVEGETREGAIKEVKYAAEQLKNKMVISYEALTSENNGKKIENDYSCEQTHILLLDRIGSESWTLNNGEPLLPPDRFRLSVISSANEILTEEKLPNSLIKMDVFDHEEVSKIAQLVHSSQKIDRVSSLSERLLLSASSLRLKFGSQGDTPEFTNQFIDKAIMKRLAECAGIKHAQGKIINSPKDLVDFAKEYKKIIVKPRALSGSQGVALIDSEETLYNWLTDCFVKDNFLAEEFISGEVCHIDALIYNGKLIWDIALYLTDTTSYRRQEPLSSISIEDIKIRNEAEKLLHKTIEAWKVNSAVLHLEAFVEGTELTFCEVAARPGGAGAVEAFEITRGINLDHAKILLDCGEDPYSLLREPMAPHSGVTVHYCHGGVLKYFDDSKVSPYAVHRKIAAIPGQIVPTSQFTGSGICTHVFAGSSQKEVYELTLLAESNVFFSVDKI
ncbi:MAG: ATP-grasp domain-containing protein [Neisseriaceae bacterium]|nr:MAG: ATP-grasp domain-containing protein [Neisseriaceae bacterium]